MIDLRMRRVRWLVGGGALLLAALAGFTLASRRCAVIVYNETTEPLAGVIVGGSGFDWQVPLMESGQSRVKGIDAGAPGGSWTARVGRAAEVSGETWFEPGPGRRLIIRVWSGELIELEMMKAWWESD